MFQILSVTKQRFQTKFSPANQDWLLWLLLRIATSSSIAKTIVLFVKKRNLNKESFYEESDLASATALEPDDDLDELR